MSCSCLSSIKSYVVNTQNGFPKMVDGEPPLDRYPFNWAEKTGNALLFPMDWVFRTFDESESYMVQVALVVLAVFTAIAGLIGAIFQKFGAMANSQEELRQAVLTYLPILEDVEKVQNRRTNLIEKFYATLVKRHNCPDWMIARAKMELLTPDERKREESHPTFNISMPSTITSDQSWEFARVEHFSLNFSTFLTRYEQVAPPYVVERARVDEAKDNLRNFFQDDRGFQRSLESFFEVSESESLRSLERSEELAHIPLLQEFVDASFEIFEHNHRPPSNASERGPILAGKFRSVLERMQQLAAPAPDPEEGLDLLFNQG
jgi:hypothetical protein